MFRVLTILATAAALAVSAAPASASSKKSPPPGPKSHTATHPRNLNDVEAIDFAVKDGTSNTILYAERSASFTIDIATSDAARNGTLTPPTRSANLTHVRGRSSGIIAVLIGL